MNRLPPELHIVHGTKAEHKGKPLPEAIRQRIPKPVWLDDPDLWDMDEFITTTADFLWDTYGIGSAQDQHLLGALAFQLDVFVKCIKGARGGGPVTKFNAGATVGTNPYLTTGEKALGRAIMIMNELGLTPRGRLATNKVESGKFAALMAGP